MGLSRATVVGAALEVLDDQGLDKVTMRAIADRLGVRHNTVRWHAASKQRLLVLMSDAIFEGLDVAALPQHWVDRFRTLARWCRHALLAHRDGARLVAGLSTNEVNTYRFGDAMIQTLLDAGFSPKAAAWTTLAVFYMILGITQEQQAQSVHPTDTATPIDGIEFPALREAAAYLTAGTFDERFEFALDMHVTALQAKRSRNGE